MSRLPENNTGFLTEIPYTLSLHAYTEPRIPVHMHNWEGPRGVPKVERLYMNNRLISSPEQHMGQLPTCKPADSLQQKEKRKRLS
jgi:hypothetical protein